MKVAALISCARKSRSPRFIYRQHYAERFRFIFLSITPKDSNSSILSITPKDSSILSITPYLLRTKVAAPSANCCREDGGRQTVDSSLPGGHQHILSEINIFHRILAHLACGGSNGLLSPSTSTPPCCCCAPPASVAAPSRYCKQQHALAELDPVAVRASACV